MLDSKTKNSGRILITISLLVACIFVTAMVYAQSKDKIEQVKTNAVIPEIQVSYKMVADVLDEFGGKAGSSNFKMKMSSGGQPSPIGKSQSSAFKLSAGYVGATFVLHGDANGNGIIELGDVVYLITYLYKDGPPPKPMEAGDANYDGKVDLGDVVYLITYLYKGGPPPCDP
jgi:glutamine cyclotransferase